MTGQTITEGFFLDPRGQAICVRFRPLAPPRFQVYLLPPLGEEMNRCRHLLSSLARWLAAHGSSCTLLDYFGTGESRGEMAEATLELWRQNVDGMIDAGRREHHSPVVILGMRLGALLALDYGSRHKGTVETLLLWQPVVSGKRYVSQLRRQHRVGIIQRTDESGETERASTVGDGIEVGGDRLSEQLLGEVSGLSIADLENCPAARIHWFEHVIAPAGPLPPGAGEAADRLRELGAAIDEQPFEGDPIWQLHKRGACDQLLEKTRELGLWMR